MFEKLKEIIKEIFNKLEKKKITIDEKHIEDSSLNGQSGKNVQETIIQEHKKVRLSNEKKITMERNKKNLPNQKRPSTLTIVREEQIKLLSKMTPYELGESKNKNALEYLRGYLENGSINEKRLSASAVSKLTVHYKKECNELIPLLIRNLDSTGSQVRQYTLKALMKLDLNKSHINEIIESCQYEIKDYNKIIINKITSKLEMKNNRDSKIISFKVESKSKSNSTKREVKTDKIESKLDTLEDIQSKQNDNVHEMKMGVQPSTELIQDYTDNNIENKIHVQDQIETEVLIDDYQRLLLKLRNEQSEQQISEVKQELLNSSANGCEDSNSLLLQITNLEEMWENSREHFRVAKGNLFYFGDYENNEIYQDSFSGRIIDLKNLNKNAIDSFFEQLNPIIPRNVVLCYFPSSNHLKIDTGIKRLVTKLSEHGRIDGCSLLYRTSSKIPSHLGGPRDFNSNLETIRSNDTIDIRNKHVILFDDVTTTGNSMLVGETVLRRSGALFITKICLGKTT